MLTTLFKDERCRHLPAYLVLKKMYLDRIIRRSDLQEFGAIYYNYIEKLAHNLLSASKVYTIFVVLVNANEKKSF